MRRSAVWGLLGAAAVAAVSAALTWVYGPLAPAAALPVLDGAGAAPRWASAAELQAAPASFPDFRLHDQAGRPFARADLRGRIVVANFFFTGCSTLCPRLSAAMARVRDAQDGAADLLLLSHSVTPLLDTPPVLAAYARANRIDGERWRLLSGAPQEVERLLRDGYRLPREPAAARAVVHTELFVLLDAQQRVRGFYNGTLGLDIAQLIRDIRTLRDEARRPPAALAALTTLTWRFR